MLEIGYDQAEASRHIARQAFPKAHIEVRQDLASLDRVLIACLPAGRSAPSHPWPLCPQDQGTASQVVTTILSVPGPWRRGER